MTSSENASPELVPFWTSAKTPYLDYMKKKGTKVDVDDDPRSMILEPKNRVGLLVGKGKERLRNIAEKYSQQYKVPCRIETIQTSESAPVRLYFHEIPEALLAKIKTEFQYISKSMALHEGGDSWAKQHGEVLKMVQESTKCNINIVSGDSPALEVSGPRPNVSLAIEALSLHVSYAPIYKEIDYQRKELEGVKKNLEDEKWNTDRILVQ